MSESVSNQSRLYEHSDALIAIDQPDNRVRAIFPVDFYLGSDGHGLIAESPALKHSMGQGRTVEQAADSFSAIFLGLLEPFLQNDDGINSLLKNNWTKDVVETTKVSARIDALRQRIHEELGQASVEISSVPGRMDDLYSVRVDNVDEAAVVKRTPKNEVV